MTTYKITLYSNFFDYKEEAIKQENECKQKFGEPKQEEFKLELKHNFGYFPKRYYLLDEEDSFYFKMKFPLIIDKIEEIKQD